MNVPGWLTGTPLASGDDAKVWRVTRGEREGVLKVARDPANERVTSTFWFARSRFFSVLSAPGSFACSTMAIPTSAVPI